MNISVIIIICLNVVLNEVRSRTDRKLAIQQMVMSLRNRFNDRKMKIVPGKKRT